MTFTFRLVSADSHIAEPPDLWTTRIDKQFRDRAPHMVSRDKGDAYIIDGESNSASLVGLLATKPKYEDPETLFGLEGRWTDVPEGAYDPSARARSSIVKGSKPRSSTPPSGWVSLGSRIWSSAMPASAPSTTGSPSIAQEPRSDCSEWR